MGLWCLFYLLKGLLIEGLFVVVVLSLWCVLLVRWIGIEKKKFVGCCWKMKSWFVEFWWVVYRVIVMSCIGMRVWVCWWWWWWFFGLFFFFWGFFWEYWGKVCCGECCISKRFFVFFVFWCSCFCRESLKRGFWVFWVRYWFLIWDFVDLRRCFF